MKSDQIRVLQAGRATDVLVAQFCFKWASVGQWDHVDKDGNFVCDDDDWVGCPPGAIEAMQQGKARASFEWLPYYTTDTDASMKVLDFIKSVSPAYSVNILYGKENVCQVLDNTVDPPHVEYEVKADTMELAVCLTGILIGNSQES